MLAVALAAALFILTAATGGSAADSCATSLPPLVERRGECSASESEELVDQVIQNVSALLPEVVHCMQVGRTPEYPADSCTELAE